MPVPVYKNMNSGVYTGGMNVHQGLGTFHTSTTTSLELIGYVSYRRHTERQGISVFNNNLKFQNIVLKYRMCMCAQFPKIVYIPIIFVFWAAVKST